MSEGRTAKAGIQAADFGRNRPSSPRLLVIPVSFVSDHIETLAEIDMEARALAQEVGLGQFELMPALNSSPRFIRALADLVIEHLEQSHAVGISMGAAQRPF